MRIVAKPEAGEFELAPPLHIDHMRPKRPISLEKANKIRGFCDLTGKRRLKK
jgi:hypothetical protein